MGTAPGHGPEAEAVHEGWAGVIRRAIEAGATMTEMEPLTRSCGCDAWAQLGDPNRIDAAL